MLFIAALAARRTLKKQLSAIRTTASVHSRSKIMARFRPLSLAKVLGSSANHIFTIEA
jgi:hypothetical protein